MNGAPDVLNAAPPAGLVEGEVRRLLGALLAHLSGARYTPLRFGIDSEGIVSAALVDVFGERACERAPLGQHWEAVTAGFDALVTEALSDEWNPPAVSHAQPDGSDQGGTRSAAGHALVGWIERFHAALRGIHFDAIEVVRLRLDGSTSREIAERLDLGLRLVARILQDIRFALAGGVSP